MSAAPSSVVSASAQQLLQKLDRVVGDAYRLAIAYAAAVRGLQANAALSAAGRVVGSAAVRQRVQDELERLARLLESYEGEAKRLLVTIELPPWNQVPATILTIAERTVERCLGKDDEPIRRLLHAAAAEGRDVFADTAAAVLFWARLADHHPGVIEALVHEIFILKLADPTERAASRDAQVIGRALVVARHGLEDAEGLVGRGAEPTLPPVWPSGKASDPTDLSELRRAAEPIASDLGALATAALQRAGQRR